MLEFLLYGIAVVAIAGLIADVITTIRVLSVGYEEENPVAVWFVKKLGIVRGISTIGLLQVVVLLGFSLVFWYAPDFVLSLVLQYVPDWNPLIFVYLGKTVAIFTFLAYYGFLHWKAALYNREGYT